MFKLDSLGGYPEVYLLVTDTNDPMRVGMMVVDIDGKYYFVPDSESKGTWSELSLREIADHLAKLNQ